MGKKRVLIALIAILFQVSIVNCQTTQKEFPVLKGPYLGQKTPGTTPEIFAPGIVSIPETTEWSSTFSPDGREFYFYRVTVTEEKPILNIYVSKLENGKWMPPVVVEFTKGYNAGTPHVTLDNKTIYFGWWRPNPAGDPDFVPGRVGRIWFAERTSKGWSEPHYAGQGMFTSSDRDGNLYTTDMSSRNINGKTYLARVIIENGLFKKSEKLKITPKYDEPAHPCIAPDGSYLLFDVDGGSHLFVSFKKKDGTWREAIDLTEHGFDVMAGGATISPDGKYLFFHLNDDIWWVDIKVIEILRPRE